MGSRSAVSQYNIASYRRRPQSSTPTSRTRSLWNRCSSSSGADQSISPCRSGDEAVQRHSHRVDQIPHQDPALWRQTNRTTAIDGSGYSRGVGSRRLGSGPMPGAETFRASADAYERHVGRYGSQLASALIDFAGIEPGMRALDVGCGPGALTAALVERLGTANVSGVDPSEPFAEACGARLPGVEVAVAAAESLPFGDGAFDASLSQLVVNFMGDAEAGVREMARVTRPGGVVASCVWDYAGEMTLLRAFWDAAREVDPDRGAAADEGIVMRLVRGRRAGGAVVDGGPSRRALRPACGARELCGLRGPVVTAPVGRRSVRRVLQVARLRRPGRPARRLPPPARSRRRSRSS